MSIDEIDSILDWLGLIGIDAAITIFVVIVVLKYLLPGYLSEKGKNIATKEDIGDITDKVESVRIEYSRLAEEIKADNQIRVSSLEREKILKKEVFMEAVEAIVRAQSVIGSVSNMNLSDDQIAKDFSVESGKIAKVQLVGGEETVKHITNFMGELGTVFLELVLERASLSLRKMDIDIQTNIRDRHQNEIDRYISIMKNMNLQGNSEPGTWDYVNKSLEFEADQLNECNKKLSDLWSAQTTEQFALTRKSSDKYFDIAHMLPSLIISVRNELDLPIDQDQYIEIYHGSLSKGVDVLKHFYDSLENINA